MDAPQYRLNCQEVDIYTQTPASSRPKRLHLLGSNTRIYITQECTTLGIRRLYLPCARAQPRLACAKRIHAPLHARSKRRVHLPCTRPKDTRVTPFCAHPRRYARPCVRVPEMRAPPCSSRLIDARAWAV